MSLQLKRVALVIVPFLLISISYQKLLIPTLHVPQGGSSIYAALEAESEKTAILILPFPKFDFNEAEYAALQTEYMHRAVESGVPEGVS